MVRTGEIIYSLLESIVMLMNYINDNGIKLDDRDIEKLLKANADAGKWAILDEEGKLTDEYSNN